MLIPQNAKVLFIGDSITDAGRDASSESGPWLPHFGLGTGYVSQVWAWLTAAFPEANISVLNKGISGNTVRDLANRWQSDVLDANPDVLAVMIGINDVWRQFDVPQRKQKHVYPEEFYQTLDSLLARARESIPHIFTATPFFIEPNRTEPMRQKMDAYADIVRELSKKHHTILIDTQAAFDAILTHLHPSALAWDRIHPGPHGHAVIARAFLKAFGLTS